MTRLRSHAGLTVVEVTLTLGALAVVAGILAPGSLDLIARAKELQASRDALSIRNAIVRLLEDTAAARIGTRGMEGQTVEMLVGGGASPSVAESGDLRWARPVDPGGLVDLLDRHLVTNEPAGNPSNAWRLPTSSEGFGWRGSYLNHEIGADPWGRRFAVNVKSLSSRNEVIVLSAGPNGVVETGFEGQGLTGGGDDVIALIK